MKLLFRQDLGTFDDLLSLQVKTDCISTQDVIVLGHKVGTICTGWATSRRLFRNTYFMAIYGEDDLASLAESCAAPTFAAGYAAYVAAPGEIVAKSAAAMAAGAAALGICAAGKALVFKVEHTGDWSDWQRV